MTESDRIPKNPKESEKFLNPIEFKRIRENTKKIWENPNEF